MVHQVLAKSQQLKLEEKFKSVDVCPDRLPEERVARWTSKNLDQQLLNSPASDIIERTVKCTVREKSDSGILHGV
jgi:hypothetical protein